jgi:hypothetical protein
MLYISFQSQSYSNLNLYYVTFGYICIVRILRWKVWKWLRFIHSYFFAFLTIQVKFTFYTEKAYVNKSIPNEVLRIFLIRVYNLFSEPWGPNIRIYKGKKVYSQFKN